MIYPRLLLARTLLAVDGLVFISIDDNEAARLRLICDEVFGEENFRNQIIVRRGAKSVQAQFDTWDRLGQSVEYILLYSRSAAYRFPKQTIARPQPRPGTWTSHRRGTDRPTMRYPLFGITPARGQWRWSKARSERAAENYRRMLTDLRKTEETITGAEIDAWHAAEGGGACDLLRLLRTGPPEHYVPPTDRALLSAAWTDLLIGDSSELRALFGAAPFDTPKRTALIRRILRFARSDALVLDFFSGSATTAHAVMQLNAEDGGKRKFIMVQLPEPFGEKTEAYKTGYKNICEIGKERIRRAGDKIKSEAGDAAADLDIGFRVLKLDSSNMQDVYYAPGDYSQDLIMQMEENIKVDRTDMDLLFACLIDWGLPLSLPHTRETVDGCTIHNYNDGALVACFDKNIGETVIRHVAKQQPLRAVFRDSGFTSAPEKIIVFETFKRLSPNTSIRVI